MEIGVPGTDFPALFVDPGVPGTDFPLVEIGDPPLVDTGVPGVDVSSPPIEALELPSIASRRVSSSGGHSFKW